MSKTTIDMVLPAVVADQLVPGQELQVAGRAGRVVSVDDKVIRPPGDDRRTVRWETDENLGPDWERLLKGGVADAYTIESTELRKIGSLADYKDKL